MKRFLPALFWIIGFQAVSAIIGLITRENMGWYDTLNKASVNPPDIAFPIVWTCLYVLLAIAAWKMWSVRAQETARLPIILFVVQMLLNWGWSFVFFAGHQVFLGFVWIVALDIAMLAFVVSAWTHYRGAALLVMPTIVWGSFAAYLNYSIWILN